MNFIRTAKLDLLWDFFLKQKGWLPGIALVVTTTVSSVLTILVVLLSIILGAGSMTFTEGWTWPVVIGVLFGAVLMNVINSFAYSGVLSSYVDIVKENKKPTIYEIFRTSFSSFFPVFWASMIQLLLLVVLVAALWYLIPVLYSIHWVISILVTIAMIFVVFISIIFSLLIIPTVFISTIDKSPIRTIFKIYKANKKSIGAFALFSIIFLALPLQPFNLLIWVSATPAYTLMLYFETINNQIIESE